MSVPAGPFTGRAQIARAYCEQPPSDTLTFCDVSSAGPADTVRLRRSGGCTGVMTITWQGRLVSSLGVTFGS